MIRSVPRAMMQEMSEGNFLRWPKRGLDDCKCILGMQMRYRYSDNSLPMVTVKYAWSTSVSAIGCSVVIRGL